MHVYNFKIVIYVHDLRTSCKYHRIHINKCVYYICIGFVLYYAYIINMEKNMRNNASIAPSFVYSALLLDTLSYAFSKTL